MRKDHSSNLGTPFLFLFLFLSGLCYSQQSTFIDEEGIIRWTETKKEVCAFGTNYSVPFSYWKWREPIGADHMKAIDEDVYHIARLGLDGYRIHVWDAFISDSIGNLVYNKHFQLYDYLQFKLKERGIKMFITPMNFFEESDLGFTNYFGGKQGCLSDPASFAVQENYLIQFLNHINPYTGIAYKDDPDIIAFAIGNEPHHIKAPELVTTYINRMYDAMRSTGYKKPIFYNMTSSANHIDKVLASKIQGGTFQWYPTGLTSNHNLKGNILPHVDQYHIPFDDKLKKSKHPKFVYEFSPSDVGASGPIYPAMARSFREAGFQFAAHFAYDPMHAAYCNVEYRTHFLNLAYTPKKAIGMMIASEVFHAVPLHKSYGRYPKNNTFESFRLDSEKDLAEMLTDNKFLYSNTTESTPPNPKKLEQIAGTGSSPLVKYSGTGAYFIDKLENGIWRLEVMPDAFWVSNPFFVPYTDRETAVTVSRIQKMQLFLPNLGTDFSVIGLNDGNTVNTKAKENTISVAPGVYLLTKKGKSSATWNVNSKWKNVPLKEFHTPQRKLEKTYVLHTPTQEVNVGEKLQLSATVISPEKAEMVELIILTKGGGKAIEMNAQDEYNYTVEVPSKFIEKAQILRYYIQVKKKEEYILFPGKEQGKHLLKRRIYPGDYRLDDATPYKTFVVPSNKSIVLFDADNDWQSITKMKRKDNLKRIPSEISGKSLSCFSTNHLNIPEHNFTLEYWCGNKIKSRSSELKNKQELVIYGKALNDKPCKIQVSLLMKNGAAFGAVLVMDTQMQEYKLILNDLKKVKSVLLPRPYPKFQKYWFEPSEKSDFNIKEIEKIQFSIGPNIPAAEWNKKHGVAIGWVLLK